MNLLEIFRKVSPIKAVFYFLFSKEAFVELAAKHDAGLVLDGSPTLQKQYSEGEYTPTLDEMRQNAIKRRAGIRNSFWKAGRWVLGALLLSVCTRFIFINESFAPQSRQANDFQIVGATIILWATLWELDADIRSFCGETLPEKVHKWLFRLFYAAGTCLFILAYLI